MYLQLNNHMNITHTNVAINNMVYNANYAMLNRSDRESSPFIVHNKHNYQILNEINKNVGHHLPLDFLLCYFLYL